jgi:hypothetical protein
MTPSVSDTPTRTPVIVIRCVVVRVWSVCFMSTIIPWKSRFSIEICKLFLEGVLAVHRRHSRLSRLPSSRESGTPQMPVLCPP